MIKKWKGPSVLYMGDHVTNDLVEPVKNYGWRTCAILREVEESVIAHATKEFRGVLAKLEMVCAWGV